MKNIVLDIPVRLLKRLHFLCILCLTETHISLEPNGAGSHGSPKQDVVGEMSKLEFLQFVPSKCLGSYLCHYKCFQK